ncbi:MAG: translesion error-prone DNA polymerase V autoproteolytic subunit [Alphaproteobacteria bacterium]|jgi:DNA polymerase V|nr:translesion error-prone DNA polymerase V autoproteolytic subunit [Alphaproteobacteria bacterium]|tara:strand:- start:6601 stop:7020 length:420 start_codon:yes stop_codon:yes gene_type:complete
MNDIVQPSCHVPYIISKVSAGFPSPADDYLENNLNLDKLLIKNRPSTFLIRAGGDSMINIGIYDGDILIVDRSLDAKSKDIVIASIFGELTVKKLLLDIHGNPQLKSENELYSSIEIKNKEDLIIWGVVTSVIHQFIKY